MSDVGAADYQIQRRHAQIHRLQRWKSSGSLRGFGAIRRVVARGGIERLLVAVRQDDDSVINRFTARSSSI
jgi:hypothetical protein